MSTSRNALAPGYKLHWYIIRNILGQGGFGITYLAQDTNLDQLVAIKEFLPVEMAVRDHDASVHPVSGEQGEDYQWGLERFINEAQTLARFRHNNIVRVMTVFTENNTAYMIMEYEQGQGLHEVLKTKGCLAQDELLRIIMPILDGLEYIHGAGFIHRDIKPPNIFIRADGSPVLLDFGSARQSLGEHTRTLTTMVSPGYAPFEQYVSKSDKQGPWTDIYGLGATMYRAVTGKSPPNAVDRSEALLQTSADIYVPAAEMGIEGYAPELLSAIDHALAFRADERPRDIISWRAEINGLLPRGQDGVATEVAVPSAGLAVTQDNTARTARIDPPAATHGHAPINQPDSGRRDWGSAYIRWVKRLIWATVILAGIIVAANISRKHRAAKSPENAGPASQVEQPVPQTSVAAEAARVAPAVTAAAADAPATATVVPESATVEAQRGKAAAGTAPSTPELISSSDRLRLASLQERLRQNPNDRTSERQLKAMIAGYNKRVREALRKGELTRAEAYIRQLLELAPDNRRLEQALEKIREAEARAGRR